MDDGFDLGRGCCIGYEVIFLMAIHTGASHGVRPLLYSFDAFHRSCAEQVIANQQGSFWLPCFFAFETGSLLHFAALEKREQIMSTITFDTLKYATRLKRAGMDERIAEEEANALSEILESGSTDLAAKGDLNVLRAEMKQEFAEVRKEVAETKTELVRWVVAVGVLQTALITALVLKLVGH